MILPAACKGIYRVTTRSFGTIDLPNAKKLSSSTIKVLFEDNHLLVISKPSDVACEAGSLFKTNKATSAKLSIQQRMEQYLQEKYNKPGKAYVALVHRLDRWTTGVMVLAKTSKAAQRLSTQFREKTVEKRYVCVISGHVATAGECRHWMTNTRDLRAIYSEPSIDLTQAILDTRAQVKEYVISAEAEHLMGSGNDKKSRELYEAHLSYRPLCSVVWSPVGVMPQSANDNSQTRSDNSITEELKEAQVLTMLDITPTTGRKHQIRAQLSHLGWPIVGDTLYSSNLRIKTDGSLQVVDKPVPRLSSGANAKVRAINSEVTQSKRNKHTKPIRLDKSMGFALHASALILSHPVTNERM